MRQALVALCDETDVIATLAALFQSFERDGGWCRVSRVHPRRVHITGVGLFGEEENQANELSILNKVF